MFYASIISGKSSWYQLFLSTKYILFEVFLLNVLLSIFKKRHFPQWRYELECMWSHKCNPFVIPYHILVYQIEWEVFKIFNHLGQFKWERISWKLTVATFSCAFAQTVSSFLISIPMGCTTSTICSLWPWVRGWVCRKISRHNLETTNYMVKQ